MSSREEILSAVKRNQPEKLHLPDLNVFNQNALGSLEEFTNVLKSVGGFVHYVNNYVEVINILLFINGEGKKIISTITDLPDYYNKSFFESPEVSDLQDIDVALVKAQFGVAENGAVWVTDKELRVRVLPFICQHLAIILNAESVVPTMHEAYDRISGTIYDFGTFIAGPSKTADIEQSLVIGAHGPRSMTVFIMNKE